MPKYTTTKGMAFDAANDAEAEAKARHLGVTLQSPTAGAPTGKTGESAQDVYARRAREVQMAKNAPAANAAIPGETDFERRARQTAEAAKK